MDHTLPLLAEAPGAKASRVCSIWALVFAVTIFGIPIGFILAVIALFLRAKAKRHSTAAPEIYAAPTSRGLALGIIALVMPMILLPLALTVSTLPGFLGLLDAARDTTSIGTMNTILPALAERYGRAQETGANAMTIKADLDAYLDGALDRKTNPHKPEDPAFRVTIAMTTAQTEQDMAGAARKQAVLGQVIFVMSAPMDPQAPRYVAGAVRTKTLIDGVQVSVKVRRIE